MFNEIMTLPGEHRSAAKDDGQPQNPAIHKRVGYFNNTIIIMILVCIEWGYFALRRVHKDIIFKSHIIYAHSTIKYVNSCC